MGAAALSLGRLGSAGAAHASILASVLKDRGRAVRHVGPAADPLQGLWAAGPQDGEWQVRRAAAVGLRSFGRDSALHAKDLAAAMHDRSAAVRKAADAALHEVGGKGVAELA